MTISYTTGVTKTPDFAYESNDCVVRTLANVTGWSYAKAHAFAKAHGRKDRKGTQTAHIMNKLEQVHGNEFKVERITDASSISLTRTVKVFGKFTSRLVVIVKKHALSIMDGVVVDQNKSGARKQVLAAWAVIPVNQVQASDSKEVPVSEIIKPAKAKRVRTAAQKAAAKARAAARKERAFFERQVDFDINPHKYL